MFYIGSVARYRPTLNEEILEGQYKSLISEVLTSSPKQFLYLIAGFMTNKICAVPMANLNSKSSIEDGNDKLFVLVISEIHLELNSGKCFLSLKLNQTTANIRELEW